MLAPGASCRLLPDDRGVHIVRGSPGSAAVGRPEHGRLVNAVQLAEQSASYLTWDPATKRSPSPTWRRCGTEHLVRLTVEVLDEHRQRYPLGSRVLVGDISLPSGGSFGRVYGGLGHSSHQSGLDVDVYYPRRDGAERPPSRIADIDPERTHDLIEHFAAAGAERIFVGRRTGLIGVVGVVDVVRAASRHEDHFHVRFPRTPVGPSRQDAATNAPTSTNAPTTTAATTIPGFVLDP